MKTRLTPQAIEEYTTKGYWSHLTVGDRLDQRIREHPHKVAVVDSWKETTYGELGRVVERLALGFLGMGVRPGDRVASQLPNRMEALAVLFALARIGAVFVPIVPYYRKAEVEYILHHSEAAAVVIPSIFADFDHGAMIWELRPRLPFLKHIIAMGSPEQPGFSSLDNIIHSPLEERFPADYLERFKPQANDVFLLNYSSGSEAAPKAPMITHNIASLAIWRTQHLGMSESDVVLNLAPLYHGFGVLMAGFGACMSHGATLLMMDKFESHEALRLVEQRKVTLISAVPPQIVSLLGCPDLHRYHLTSLRVIVTSGTSPSPAAIPEVRARMGCPFINIWGMSEGGSSMPRLNDPPDVLAKTVGRPVHPAVEVGIFDEDRQRKMPPEKIGEVALRGPTVFVGYYKDAQRTEECFNQEGWYFTGDLGWFGQDGNLRLVGRMKDMINRGGEKISPREIEDLLLTHPKIQDAVLVGMPDPRLGERACAYVIPRPGQSVTLEEITTFLKGKDIAIFKLPERLEVRREFPMTPSGKVRKSLLREDINGKLREGERP